MTINSLYSFLSVSKSLLIVLGTFPGNAHRSGIIARSDLCISSSLREVRSQARLMCCAHAALRVTCGRPGFFIFACGQKMPESKELAFKWLARFPAAGLRALRSSGGARHLRSGGRCARARIRRVIEYALHSETQERETHEYSFICSCEF